MIKFSSMCGFWDVLFRGRTLWTEILRRPSKLSQKPHVKKIPVLHEQYRQRCMRHRKRTSLTDKGSHVQATGTSTEKLGYRLARERFCGFFVWFKIKKRLLTVETGIC